MNVQNNCETNKTYYLLLLLAALQINSTSSAQQFSEIMFAPLESNSEFIEIYNSSDSAIDLTGFKVKYHTSTSDEIISVNSNYNLEQSQYALIFEADYDLVNGIYSNSLPDSVLIFTLDDNSFGSSGMANTSDRKLYFIDSRDDTVDSYIYSADNEKGYSDEIIIIGEDDWANSNILNGTPGIRNSVSPIDYDLAITECFVDPKYLIIGRSAQIHIFVKNIGLLAAEEFTISVFSIEENEYLYYEHFDMLVSHDSLRLTIPIGEITKVENNFICEIVFDSDEILLNNYYSLNSKGILINEERGDIVINEIMYAPESLEPEWIEIFNKSENSIDLCSYQIADQSDTVKITISSIIIEPNGYYVFADDSSFQSIYTDVEHLIYFNLPTLNNSGDELILLDSLNRIIDSLYYSSEWGGHDGQSLERIDPDIEYFSEDNWKESNFPTPGRINSVSQKVLDIKLDTVYTIPKIPLIDSIANIAAEVRNIGKTPAQFNIQLYGDYNSDTLADNLIESSNTIFVSSGESVTHIFSYEAQVSHEVKNYIIRVIIDDDDSTNNSRLFSLTPSFPIVSILINEIMYSPINFEPEWIELFNNSNYDINLKNWSIGDVLTNPIFKSINDELIVESKNYTVISKNKSIYNFHRIIPCPVYELSFANLNNDNDGLVLLDNNGRTIDSINYSNDWGGNDGRSLERINHSHSSISNNNWKSSIDIEGSTPGRINSVTFKNNDLSVQSIAAVPGYPINGDSIKIIAKIKNFGSKDCEDFDLIFSAFYGDQMVFNEHHNGLFLSKNDSTNITSTNSLIISDTVRITVNINFISDEDINNNFFEKTLIPGFNSASILINEIMFKPLENDPEWIEIINNSKKLIDLKGWLIGDKKEKLIITENNLLLEPNSYLILSDYSSVISDIDSIIISMNFPDLGNTADDIIIYDFRGAPIDSVGYKVSSSFKYGTSLERLSTSIPSKNEYNWSFSLDQLGSTPGKINSISNQPNHQYGDMIVSEIMFDPSDNNSEFIEVYNNSNNNIEIGGWNIVLESIDRACISNYSFNIAPNEYFVIAADSAILDNYNWLYEFDNISILNKNTLNLTNDGKLIYITNIRGTIIDSISYSDKWHNSSIVNTKNRSLELINNNLNRTESRNWSSSVSPIGATPGKENSINVVNLPPKAKLNITPNPFSPDYDGFEDYTFINYNLTQPISQTRIRVYDSKGRYVKTISNNHPVGSKGTIIFDGLDRNKNPLKIGIYIILFEAVNEKNRVVEIIKEVVVIARKL